MLTGMDAVLPYHIPELHPLAVHFPLALLVLAAFSAIVWMCLGTWFWRRVTGLLTAIGAMTALVAYLTGEPMKEQAEGVPIVDELVGLHEQMALYTLVTASVATLALGAHAWWVRRHALAKDPLGYRLVIGLLIIAAGVLVAWTGHIGSTMVWGVAR